MLAAANGADEVGEMIAEIGAGRSRRLLAAEEAVVLAGVRGPQLEETCRSIKSGANRTGLVFRDTGFEVGEPVADFEHHHLFSATIACREAGVERVGRRLIAVEHEVAAKGADAGGIFYSQAPTGRVDLMDALVSDVAVAIVPEP